MSRLKSLLCLVSLAFPILALAATPQWTIDMNGKTAQVAGP
jgi:hypothetical protein